MTEQRVNTLPATGALGIIYIVEPGAASYYWDGSDYMIYEQRSQSVQYYGALKDVTGFRDTEVVTSQ